MPCHKMCYTGCFFFFSIISFSHFCSSWCWCHLSTKHFDQSVQALLDYFESLICSCCWVLQFAPFCKLSAFTLMKVPLNCRQSVFLRLFLNQIVDLATKVFVQFFLPNNGPPHLYLFLSHIESYSEKPKPGSTLDINYKSFICLICLRLMRRKSSPCH